MNLFLDIW